MQTFQNCIHWSPMIFRYNLEFLFLSIHGLYSEYRGQWTKTN